MPWSVRLSPELLDRRYDPYRNAIAELQDAAGNVTGYLVTYAREVDNFQGFSRLRPKWRPTEVFVGWFVPTEGRADEEYLDLEDIDSGSWGPERLRWLQGAERDGAWQRYLDEWGPHEASHLADSREVGEAD